MVQRTQTTPAGLEGLLELIPSTWSASDVDLIRRAYELAQSAHEGQSRASGEAYIHHPLAVAAILAELKLDAATIAAGLLHDVVEDTPYDIEYIRQHFGDEVARLVDGVTKLEQLDQFRKPADQMADGKAESLRKMFLAMVDDVRVVLIKLADRLHNMRTLGSLPEHKRRRIARETMDIFAPLANRLGIWQLKWELEDLAFRHLQPATYKELARKIDQRRQDRERYVQKVIAILSQELEKAGIQAEVTGRPKHIYSIWRKMKRKGVDFEQIYDAQGVRVIVDTVRDCYAALGVVHSLWRPIPGEFDDYIANPKDNMYRSLHTAVVGPDGRPMEVQIRTWEMHRTAEYGIAAHWRYKEQIGGRRDIEFENKIAWLRQLMDWRQEVTDAQEFVDSMKTDVFQDRVYVFTPKGDVIDLPAGATPIDFAYHVHTEVGHRCRGARVNGRLVSLDYQLQNGDQVEIITAKRGGPSRDWLNPNLGYVKTQRARGKIRQWFRRLDRDVNIAEGREVLDRELRRLSVDVSYETIAKLFNFESVDDLLAAIGYGDINPQQIATKVMDLERRDQEAVPATDGERPSPPIPMDGVSVTGVSGLLTHPARCCNPLPGDEIVGYVTRGRGVSIHKRDCPNILFIAEPERLIEVSWGVEQQRTYPVSIIVRAFDRAGLLRDIATVVADEKVNMREAQAITGLKDNTAVITATIDVTGIAQLSRLLTKIEQLPNVLEARRQVG
ncbi:MAG: bifunctional (p)ppGpp synthetase/guanosine-3',5'-bis(diphosphate) 3'-pyrophosphohydrolase [Anaerolineae bacterium]